MRELSSLEMSAVGGGAPSSRGASQAAKSRPKGNNGWGNGAEGVIGSSTGATAGSKSDEKWDGVQDGPRPAKFTSR